MPLPTSPEPTEFKEGNAAADRKSVEIGHLFAVNLLLGTTRQIIGRQKDRCVSPVQAPGSFVGFPSFYMQPDKTLRLCKMVGQALACETWERFAEPTGPIVQC
jgi:hypothetical protein